MRRLQILRGQLQYKPELKDGEFFLDKTNHSLLIGDAAAADGQFELAKQSSITNLQQQVNTKITAEQAPVQSVNSKTGAVVLTAADVGALPDTTSIPTKTSELDNDSGFITAAQAPVQSVDGATGAVTTNAVKYTTQTLTDDQKTQARTNIGAGTSSFSGSYNDLSNKPTIPTKVTDLTDAADYATVTSVNAVADDVEMLNSEVGTLTSDVDTLKTNITSKQNTITGGASTITDDNLTANRALISNGSGKVAVSDITATELGYLSGVTSNIQTQIDGLDINEKADIDLENVVLADKESFVLDLKYSARRDYLGSVATDGTKVAVLARNENADVYVTTNGTDVTILSYPYQTMGDSVSGTQAIYGNGKWLFLTYGKYAFYSTDDLSSSSTLQVYEFDTSARRIGTYIPGLDVFAVFNYNSNIAYYSQDLVSWTKVEMNITGKWVKAIFYKDSSNTRVMLIGENDLTLYYTNPYINIFTTWNSITIDVQPPETGYTFKTVLDYLIVKNNTTNQYDAIFAIQKRQGSSTLKGTSIVVCENILYSQSPIFNIRQHFDNVHDFSLCAKDESNAEILGLGGRYARYYFTTNSFVDYKEINLGNQTSPTEWTGTVNSAADWEGAVYFDNSFFIIGSGTNQNYSYFETFTLNSTLPSIIDKLNSFGLAKTSDIPTVPTKTSELTNDSGYITQTDGDGRYLEIDGSNAPSDLTMSNTGLVVKGITTNNITVNSGNANFAGFNSFGTIQIRDAAAVRDATKYLDISSEKFQFTDINNGMIIEGLADIPSSTYVNYGTRATNKNYVDQYATHATLVTLTVAGWNSTAKTQTVTVSGILADESKQLIIPMPATASMTAYNDAGIQCTGQAADSLTFTAETVPTTAISVYVTYQTTIFTS